MTGKLPKPLRCSCGNAYLISTNIFAADGSGPVEYDSPLLCWGCNRCYIPETDTDGSTVYRPYSNVTALVVLRQIQPPADLFEA